MTSQTNKFFQITAPHFCAGGSYKNGHIYSMAPIIYYMKGWTRAKVMLYCQEKGWNYEQYNYDELERRVMKDFPQVK